MSSEDENSRLRAQFLESCKAIATLKGQPTYNVDLELANETINYILQQINEFTKTSYINDRQYSVLFKRADEGLRVIVYIKYWTDDTLLRDPVYDAAYNHLALQYSKVLFGKQRELELAQIHASQPLTFNNR